MDWEASSAGQHSSIAGSSFKLKERPVEDQELERVGSEEEEAGGGEEADEDEDEEEDDEPLLKYSRFHGPGVNAILKQYSITAATAHDKMMVRVIYFPAVQGRKMADKLPALSRLIGAFLGINWCICLIL